ncbi:hypothetical protein BH18GEM1_BH18GEM1_18080 [soil metagenome]
MSGRVVLAALLLVLSVAAPAGAQIREGEPPPAGGIVPLDRSYAVGLGVGMLRWDDAAPYANMPLVSLSIERRLWSFIRGRAGVGVGQTDFVITEAGTGAGGDPVDIDLYAIDLQVLFGADFGPFRAAGVVPYAVAGVGSVVTDPAHGDERELPTRSQSQATYGGGVLARVLDRWEARGEVTVAALRLADPVNGEERQTETIHNLRWEGRVSWLF